jgi:hypothetical protein
MTYSPAPFRCQLSTASRPPKTRSGSGSGASVLDRECLGEQLLAKLVGTTDRAQVVLRMATLSQRRSASSRRNDQGAERPHGRRLPGAVRPQKPEHLAVADLERDILEGDTVTETLRQLVDGKRRGIPLRVTR